MAQAAVRVLQPLRPVLWKKVAIPGKGNGLVAACFLPSNTEVFREMPIVTGSQEGAMTWDITARLLLSFSDPVKLSDGTHLTEDVLFDRFTGNGAYRQSWNEHDQASLEAVQQLGPFDVKRIYDIVCTNNINCGEIGKEGPTGLKGFFEHASMFNHSCFPTCVPVVLNPSTGFTAFYTLQDVAEGEELTFCYSKEEIVGAVSAAEKKKIFDEHMQETFGFTCECDPYET